MFGDPLDMPVRCVMRRKPDGQTILSDLLQGGPAQRSLSAIRLWGLCYRGGVRLYGPAPLEFNNVDITGGYAAKYANLGEDYPSHECMVDSIRAVPMKRVSAAS